MQEGVSAMGCHLRLKLPGNICEPQLGSHANWQNYSGKRRRKAERNKLPFFHDFKALTTIVEFCSSQLLLDLSPTLTELVRKEKISSLKITTTKQNKKKTKWRAVRNKHRRSEKKAGLIITMVVPPTPLCSAKFYRCTSQAAILFWWILPLKRG